MKKIDVYEPMKQAPNAQADAIVRALLSEFKEIKSKGK